MRFVLFVTDQNIIDVKPHLKMTITCYVKTIRNKKTFPLIDRHLLTVNSGVGFWESEAVYFNKPNPKSNGAKHTRPMAYLASYLEYLQLGIRSV